VEIRRLDGLGVTPSQVGFPGVQLVARWQTRVRRKGQGSEQTVYRVSRHTLEEWPAEGWLRRKRGDWVIESRRPPCLEVTLQEDRSRGRSPKAARGLGRIRRVIVSLANAAVDRARKAKPKTKCNTKSFRQRFLSARGGRERLDALLFAKSPNVLDLQN
jgi:hypothetical protein